MPDSQPPNEKPENACILNGISAGSLEVLVSDNKEDIIAAQELRYQVFFEEMGALKTDELLKSQCDVDIYDDICDHLLVIDHKPCGERKIVGTYRLIRRESIKELGHFYTDGEYDISLIKNHPGEILEVGRSCVHAQYRNRAVMQLLWRGIGAYVARHNIELLFGCASFNGTDPEKHAMALSYLHHYHLAPEKLRPRALKELYVEMNCMPKEAIDVKRTFASLPALIKGYIRLNGYIGAGAVIDKEYNTTDVSIVVKTDLIHKKYANRYGADVQSSSS